jgi:hypothetical protein
VLHLGKRARQPIGDVLEVSKDTFIERDSLVNISSSETRDQGSGNFCQRLLTLMTQVGTLNNKEKKHAFNP